MKLKGSRRLASLSSLRSVYADKDADKDADNCQIHIILFKSIIIRVRLKVGPGLTGLRIQGVTHSHPLNNIRAAFPLLAPLPTQSRAGATSIATILACADLASLSSLRSVVILACAIIQANID